MSIRVGKIVMISLLQVGLLIYCIHFLLENIQLANVISMIGEFDKTAIVFVSAFSIFHYSLQSLRLLFLFPGKFSFIHGVGISLFGIGANVVLPAKLGEILRMNYLHRVSRIEVPVIFSGVFWERLMDINILLLCMLMLGMLSSEGIIYPLLFFVLCIWLILICAIVKPEKLESLITAVTFGRLKGILVDTLQEVILVYKNKRLTRILLLTLAVWGQYVVQIFLVFYFVAGVELDITQFLIIFSLIVLAITIPSTPGAIGVLESAILIGLGWFGIGSDKAFAVALFIHFLYILPAVFALLLLSLNHSLNYFGKGSACRD